MKNIEIIKVVINDKFGFIISDCWNLFLNNWKTKLNLLIFILLYEFKIYISIYLLK